MSAWTRWERRRLLSHCRAALPLPELDGATERDVEDLLCWFPPAQRGGLRLLSWTPPRWGAAAHSSRFWILRETAGLVKLVAGMLWEARRGRVR